MTKEEFLEKAGKYYTRQELADALGVSLSTVKRMLTSFDLKSKDCFKQKEKKIKEKQTANGIYGSTIKNKELYRQKFLELYNQNLNDSDIAKELGVNNVTIHNWRVSMNLPSNFKYKRSFDENKFIELYNQGLSYTDIAKELNISKSCSQEYGSSLGLTPNKITLEDMSSEEFQIFLGNILGDGCLKQSGGGDFAHSLAQAEYFYWKYNKLRRICNIPKFKEEFDERTGKYYSCLYSTYKSCVCVNKFYPQFYNNFIKYINKDLFSKIEPLGLAIWFMDDGCFDHNSISIATNYFTDEDINIIIELLQNKFDLHFKKQASNIIRLSNLDFEKFKNLIYNYMHPSLLYKFGSR